MAVRAGIWRKALKTLTAAAVLLATVSGFSGLPGAGAAAAQERPRTVMDMLFGRQAPRRRYLDEAEPRRIIRKKPKPRRARPGAAAKARGASAVAGPRAEVPAVVAKSATAKTVLVVGDFMAGSLAGGLEAAVAGTSEVKVVSAADGSSGLVRDDHFDWVGQIGPMIDERKPSVVVVMLGSNDRQQLASRAGALPLRSEDWTAEYERRATALAGAVKAKNVPLIWVGMPSFKSPGMSGDMVFFNELYRKAAASAGGEFVDVWEGFVDASGAFASSGPDIAGQQARLRSSNGITMTAKGAEKLAFFAQKPIFRIVGTPTEPGVPGVASADPAKPEQPAPSDAANATAAPALGLTDPALEGGETLLGGGVLPAASAKPSPRELLVIAGSPVASPVGRADEFSWNAKTPAVSPSRVEETVVSRGSIDLKTLRSGQGIKPPPEMPSLADAIIEDWASQPAATPPPPGVPATPVAPQDGALPSPAGIPDAAPAPASVSSASGPSPAAGAPVSASPFAEDQALR